MGYGAFCVICPRASSQYVTPLTRSGQPPKSNQFLLVTHRSPPKKNQQNLSTYFSVIPLTERDRQTNRQTPSKTYIFLVGGRKPALRYFHIFVVRRIPY